MSGSFVLPQLVSVLITLAHDATKGHTAVQGLGHTMLVSVLGCHLGQVFLSGQCCQLASCDLFGSWVSGPKKSPTESKESKSKTQTNKQLHMCAPSSSALSGILVMVNPSFDDLHQKFQQVPLHKWICTTRTLLPLWRNTNLPNEYVILPCNLNAVTLLQVLIYSTNNTTIGM